MARPFVWIAWIPCALAIAACSSFESSTPSDVADGGPADAASSADAPPAPAPDAALSGCAAHSGFVFCDDFDGAGAQGWSALWVPHAGTGGQMATSSPGFSAPNALIVGVPAVVSSPPMLARMGVDLGAPSHVTIDLMLRVDASDAAAECGLFAFGPTGIDNLPHVRLEVGQGMLALLELDKGQVVGSSIAVTTPPSAFEQVTIRIDYTKATPHAELLVSGQSVGGRDLAASFPKPSSASIRLGMLFLSSAATSPWRVAFDDFVLSKD